MAPLIGAAFTAAWIDVYGAVGQSKWSSSTTSAGSAITRAEGRACVGTSVRSQAAPRYAIAGKVRTAAILRNVCIGLLLEHNAQCHRQGRHSEPRQSTCPCWRVA